MQTAAADVHYVTTAAPWTNAAGRCEFANPVLHCANSCLPAGATAGALLGRGCRGLLEVVVRGEVLQEVALLLHDAVELVRVDGTVAVTVSLVDHVLELLVVDALAKLLGHTGEVLEGDL